LMLLSLERHAVFSMTTTDKIGKTITFNTVYVHSKEYVAIDDVILMLYKATAANGPNLSGQGLIDILEDIKNDTLPL
jgi:hypothetical protein